MPLLPNFPYADNTEINFFINRKDLALRWSFATQISILQTKYNSNTNTNTKYKCQCEYKYSLHKKINCFIINRMDLAPRWSILLRNLTKQVNLGSQRKWMKSRKILRAIKRIEGHLLFLDFSILPKIAFPERIFGGSHEQKENYCKYKYSRYK